MTTVIESDVIAGVYVVDPVVHSDDRGVFIETYRREWFRQGREMVQGTEATASSGRRSASTTTYTRPTTGACPRTRVVLHDLRQGSPTDGATLALDLGKREDGSHDHRGIFILPGVAHGFAAITDMTTA
jgi:dTDP-4-dehydrorhamnose 3,5-epimerase